MSQDYTPSYEPAEPLGEQPKDNKTLIIIIVVAVVLLLCCCCLAAIGGYWLYDSGNLGSILLPSLVV